VKLFIDASALVSVLAREEEDFEALGKAILSAEMPLWSPISRWETIAALCSSYKLSPAEAQERADQFATENRIVMAPIGEDEASLAFDAYRLYGKGSGHDAKLNMGDCFAYACAKANDAALLYKGNDFIHTDLA
jgi:ribonuclease VapC